MLARGSGNQVAGGIDEEDEEELPRNLFARGSSEVSQVSTLVNGGLPEPVPEDPPNLPHANLADGPWPDPPHLVDEVHHDVFNFGGAINWSVANYARVFAWARIGNNARTFLDDTDPNKYQRLFWASGCAQEHGFVPWNADF